MRIRGSKLLGSCLAASALALAGRSEAQVAQPIMSAPIVLNESAPAAVNSVQLDYLLMRRSTPNSQPLVNSVTGASVFNATDFDFDFESGVQAKYIHQTCDGWGYEFRYFGIYDTNAQASFPVPPNGTAATNPPTFITTDGNFTGNFFYRSDLNSFELNGRRTLSDRLTLIAGVRYINLNERFGGTYGDGSPIFATQDSTVNNSMFGLQTGVDANLWNSCSGKLRVDGFVRAGIYNNDVSTTFRAEVPAVGFVRGGDDSQNRASFVADLGVNASYQISQNVSVRLGYQFLWLSGVALATEQLSTTDNFNPTGTGVPRLNFGDAFYNGINFGVEYRW